LSNDIKAFFDALTPELERIRSKDPAEIRLLEVDQGQRADVEMAFHGSAARRGTMVWSVPFATIEDATALGRSAIAFLIQELKDAVEKDLDKKGLLYDPPYRVVRKHYLGDEDDEEVKWTEEKHRTVAIWEGFDLSNYAVATDGRLGRIDQGGRGGRLFKTVLVAQTSSGGGWVDMDPQPRIVPGTTAPSTSKRPPDPSLADALTRNIPQQPMMPGMQQAIDSAKSASERKRERRDQAIANRQAAQAQAAHLDPEAEARREQQRQEAERRAEESRRRAEEERVRRERVESIEKAAGAPWLKAPEALQECIRTWQAAAVHEADARDAQVEAELFGGGSDLDAGAGWVEAEKSARALLDFLQERVDEAQARRTGKGFENIYAEEDDAAVERAAQEGIQEHADEAEAEVAKQRREAEELRRETERSKPETGDDDLDDLLEGGLGPDADEDDSMQASPQRGGLRDPMPSVALSSIPGLFTKPAL